ncbi:hypothetical protein Mycch_5981 (plasmid) [Mycolicibacterium chubuense NBB4]|uniref:Putative 2-oxopent-4-enoate hydratase n=1 Tax=Mycolicibacterium chubuense (strain NBB4) TaxID=710421 RepID=D2K2E2_MYCCN|nr:fumarylacetoacetate hydrolase [Mycolicibacterium chubuense]ACZ56348.1 putative 2-oxopent-4-enoate hydratase [Mycolicibacterium chubuense NBB4]AFM20585.1 hypothetical protein Mycch_5981 [Mycolicibacterium chubuense NBB4]
MLKELQSAFSRNGSHDFFSDSGVIATHTGPVVGYVLSKSLIGIDFDIDDSLEPITERVLVEDCGVVSVGSLVAPRVETHIGVLLSTRVSGDTAVRPDECIAAAFPVLRVLTGNGEAISAAIAVGSPSLRKDVLEDSLASLNRNGSVVAAGEGAAIGQSPGSAFAAIARRLVEADQALSRGHIVLTGSIHRSVPARPGDHFRCDVLGLGSVCIRCVD